MNVVFAFAGVIVGASIGFLDAYLSITNKKAAKKTKNISECRTKGENYIICISEPHYGKDKERA